MKCVCVRYGHFDDKAMEERGRRFRASTYKLKRGELFEDFVRVYIHDLKIKQGVEGNRSQATRSPSHFYSMRSFVRRRGALPDGIRHSTGSYVLHDA